MIKFNAMGNDVENVTKKVDQPLFEGNVKFEVDEFSCKVIVTYDFVNPENLTAYLETFKDNKTSSGNLPLIREESVDLMGIKLKIGGYARDISSCIAAWKAYLLTFEQKRNKEKSALLSEYDATAKKYADCIIQGKSEEAERHLRKLQELKAKTL